MSPFRRYLLASALGAAALLGAWPAMAQDKIIAKVNGTAITEADMRFAEAEIGNDLGSLPPETRRRVLLEYVIENQLFADAAEGDKLGSGARFDERMQYWRRRALRDAYFDSSVRTTINVADARKIYDQQITGAKSEEELRARHILVESEERAKEVFEKIAHGEDFSRMAKEFSKDSGSKDDGGDLGYFSRGQMVPQFEEAVFKLNKGDISVPVQTQFGWHLIKLEDRRTRGAPPFETVKDRLMASMIHRKAQEIATALREKAKLEYVDEEIRKQVEGEKAIKPAPR